MLLAESNVFFSRRRSLLIATKKMIERLAWTWRQDVGDQGVLRFIQYKSRKERRALQLRRKLLGDRRPALQRHILLRL